MFEQKSDKKLMTTVVLGWRRAAERGRMERRQGDEMAAAAAAAAAVEEQQMAVKERMAKAKFASNMLGVRTTAFIGWKGVWEAAALTRKQEALADEQRRLRDEHESQRNEADIKAFAVKENLAIKLMVRWTRLGPWRLTRAAPQLTSRSSLYR